MMRAIWLSANLFGYEMLKSALMIRDVEVATVVTLGERAKTRMYDGVNPKKWRELVTPVHQIENINESADFLRSLSPDLMVVCGWRQIINGEVLSIPRKGTVGFHPTLLPKGRGPAPIINTILEGFDRSGVTMYHLNDGVDSGDIIGKAAFHVGSNDYAWDIYRKVVEAGRKLVWNHLPELAAGTAPRIKQDDSKATYFRKRTLEDNEIQPRDSPEMRNRKIRAFSKPYRGAFVKFGGKKIVIWRGEAER